MRKIQISELFQQNATLLKNKASRLARNSMDGKDPDLAKFSFVPKRQRNHQRRIHLRRWFYVTMRNILININPPKKKLFQTLYMKGENWQCANIVDKASYTDIYSDGISSEVDKLPNKFKTPLLLYMKGYKYAEIASLLNEPVVTIKSRIIFAKQLLQSILERS